MIIVDQEGRRWEINYVTPSLPIVMRPTYLHGWRGHEKQIVRNLRRGYDIIMVNPQGARGLRRPWNRVEGL